MDVTFMVHCFFRSLVGSQYLSLFLLSFSFFLRSAGTLKSTNRLFLFFFSLFYFILKNFFFFFYFDNVWSSGRDEIRLYLKIQNNLECLIFKDGFWVAHIPFVRMVKPKFLARFPMNYLPHKVVSSLILLALLTTTVVILV